MHPVAQALITLSRDVRTRTLHILGKAEAAWVTRTVPGTANHMIWHVGHALWVQDAICVELLAGKRLLPLEWADRFGMESRPATDRDPWPSRDVVTDMLTRQLTEVERLLSAADSRLDDHELVRQIIHGFHDEAIHQGEMHLLLKMFRAGAKATPDSLTRRGTTGT